MHKNAKNEKQAMTKKMYAIATCIDFGGRMSFRRKGNLKITKGKPTYRKTLSFRGKTEKLSIISTAGNSLSIFAFIFLNMIYLVQLYSNYSKIKIFLFKIRELLSLLSQYIILWNWEWTFMFDSTKNWSHQLKT